MPFLARLSDKPVYTAPVLKKTGINIDKTYAFSFQYTSGHKIQTMWLSAGFHRLFAQPIGPVGGERCIDCHLTVIFTFSS